MQIPRRKRNLIRKIRAWRARRRTYKLLKIVGRKEMRKHVSLTWKTGCWKSVTMAQIVYAHRTKTQRKQNEAILVIDPHGDTYATIKKFDLALKNPARLVCIDPSLKEGYTATINPLEMWSWKLRDIEITTQSLVSVFEELIPDAKLTNYMKALLNPCIATLLSLRTCSITDLKDFMRTNPPEELLLAGKNSLFAAHRKFFQEEFMNHSIYWQTKWSIYTKLQSLLNNSWFYNQVIWKSTINLESCLRSWKVILINLGALGPDAGEAFWRFIIGQTKAIAMRSLKRAPLRRPRVQIYIDEADAVITTSLNGILKETRKVGLSAFICGQSLPSWRWSEAMKHNLLTNTSVKIIWTSGQANLQVLSKETWIKLTELHQVKNYEFRIKSGDKRPRKIRTKDVFRPRSPLLIDPYETTALNKFITERSWAYKPILPLHPNPGEEWLDAFPDDLKWAIENKLHPRPKFGSYPKDNHDNSWS